MCDFEIVGASHEPGVENIEHPTSNIEHPMSKGAGWQAAFLFLKGTRVGRRGAHGVTRPTIPGFKTPWQLFMNCKTEKRTNNHDWRHSR